LDFFGDAICAEGWYIRHINGKLHKRRGRQGGAFDVAKAGGANNPQGFFAKRFKTV